ncbi:MAG: zinc-binding dehydrogenase [Chitinophagales bacterium]|nr:zinc-binding dehydrogenase [Chitinophagales bacterium]
MKALFLVRNGKTEEAFELRDIKITEPGDNEVGVEVEAFGLNFADVMARLGLYKDCPPLPTIIGYETVGRVLKIGKNITHVKEGDRVIAFTRFGGYSQYVITQEKAVVKIDEHYDVVKALALATQYCTAFYACSVATNVLPGEKVLVQAAAGGVGTALVQLCKLKGAIIYGTAGSPSKIEYLKQQGVDFPINYNEKSIDQIPEKMDVVFDSLGGADFKKGFNLLNQGGRLVGYGAASQTEGQNIFGLLKLGIGFGIYHPVQLLMESRAIIGVNMLRIADYKPNTLQYCMEQVVALAEAGKIDPTVGGLYGIDDIGKAHSDLEKRKTIGKLGIKW